MIIQWFKMFILKNQPMTLSLIVAGVSSSYLYAVYLRSHQDYYLDLLWSVLSTEGLIVILFSTFKLLKSIRTETKYEEKLRLLPEIMISKTPILLTNLLIALTASGILFFAYLQTRQPYYLDLIEKILVAEGLILSVYLGLKLLKTWISETNLKEKEEKLKFFTELMEEAILIREGSTVVEVNDVLARMLGYQASEMIGQNIYKFMSQQSAENNKEWIKKGYPADRFELMGKHKDGTTVPILVHGRNIIYKGRPMRLSCGWDITEFKKMQETIEKSEERFKRFAGVTKEGIMVHDKGVVVDVNQALADMLGMSPADFIGKDSLFFVEKKSAEEIKKFRAGLISALPYEIGLRHSEGRLIQVETYATDILWQGREARVVRIWDVSERKKIEKALMESQERFKRFAEVTKEGILVHDKGIIVDVNQALLDLMGYPASEVIGKENLFFIDKASIPKVLEFRKKGYPNESYELDLRRADGTLIPVEAHGAAFSWGGREFRVVRIWNLMERKINEKALEESRERFKRFAEVAKEGIEIHDHGVIVDANQALADMLGYTVEEMIGKDIRDFSDEKTNEFATPFIKNGGGLPTNPTEITLRRKDGTFFPTEVYGAGFKLNGRDLRVVSLWDITERKKMEQELLESQERFKRFSELSKEGIIIHENGVIADVNPAGAEMIGYFHEEIIGRGMTEFLDEAGIKRAMQLLQEGKFAKSEEFNIIRKDKTIIPVEVTGAAVNMGGKNLRITNFWDLSARKQMEEALRQSEESFRNLIEKSPDAMSIHTPQKTVYVNEALLKMLGYSHPDELIGRVPEFFVYSEDAAKVRDRIANLKKPGDYNPPAERRFVRKDGTIIWVDVVSFSIYFEGVLMTVAISRNNTERKKAEEALRQSEKNFRNLIERSPDGVLIHTLEDKPKIVYINDAMLKLVGYSSVELLGQQADFFVHSGHVQGVQERIEKMRSMVEYNPPQEKVFIRKNGELIYAEAVSFLIHYEGVTMAAVWVRDLTERKKSEEALMKLERLSTIGEMAAGMAHEIRNPLAAISTAAQILKRRKSEENRGPVETILEQSDRLEKLIRDTLDYAKTSVGPIFKSFSVKSALESALNLSQIQFGPSYKKIKVSWDLPREDIHLNADLGRVQQILVNLILNAFQIVGEDGEIKLGLKSDNQFVFIRVEDNGSGISEANMKRIFEPFFTTKDHGSGLGLAISQRIAQEHNGQIKVERLKPRGTAFTLQIPLIGELEE
jgi:PAS domain S-box-containing protein